MSIIEKIKITNNKVDQTKEQHYLFRQTTKISDLSSGNISKYEFLTGKDFWTEKYLLEKDATMKQY